MRARGIDPQGEREMNRMAAWIVVGVVLLSSVPFAGARGKADEPARVVVQHILIGYKRSVPGKVLQRSREQAKALAEELLRRAQGGEDFDALVKQYSDDRYPGKMVLTNTGAPEVAGGTRRDEVVPRFGDVAFSLAVSEIGLSAHHAALSQFGWHVIKRLE
jgi:hypothetical protein